MDCQTPSHSSDLDGRILWYDGRESVDPALVVDALLERGSMPEFVTEITDEIKQYNLLSPEAPLLIRKEGEGRPAWAEWTPGVLKIDVDEEITRHLSKLLTETPKHLHQAYIERVAEELALYEKLGMTPILRACLYIVNRLQQRNAVWGVGRGSAVASFVLYVIGIHDINSVKYGLHINEFLGEQDAT